MYLYGTGIVVLVRDEFRAQDRPYAPRIMVSLMPLILQSLDTCITTPETLVSSRLLTFSRSESEVHLSHNRLILAHRVRMLDLVRNSQMTSFYASTAWLLSTKDPNQIKSA